MMIKRIAVSLISLVMLTSMASCSLGKTDESSAVSDKEISITAKEIIEKAVEKSGNENLDSTAFYGEDLYKENCEKLYSISYDNVLDGGIVYAGSGGLADEISVIRAKDMSEDMVEQYLQKRVDRRIQDFTGYKPAEIGKIDKSVVFSANGFSVLIISDNADKIQAMIRDIITNNK